MPSSALKKCALRSEEHTSELQSHDNLVCRLLPEKKNPATRRSSRARAGAVRAGARRVRGARGRAPRRGGREEAVERLARRVLAPLFFFKQSGAARVLPPSPQRPPPF